MLEAMGRSPHPCEGGFTGYQRTVPIYLGWSAALSDIDELLR
jgi:hypothetical protein